jgi:phosphomannomutase
MRIDHLMTESGVKFGTSGARGLAADMTDRVCYAYTAAFLQYLVFQGAIASGADLAMAGDLRPSSPRILAACARSAVDLGFRPRYFGPIPTPALAAYGITHGIPSLMVTGSHIPDDRNGIKFNRPSGEILKADEAGIRAQEVALPSGLFDTGGAFLPGTPSALPGEEPQAYEAYVARYLGFFPRESLAGLRVGVYEHSSVARRAYVDVLQGLGAQVKRLGFSERFVPVDTEAIRPEDVGLARDWAADGSLDALVSADGDGDRPLVADERGEWLRGDIAGILCARALGARGVVTPVSSNTAVERCGAFERVLRTRIGSPFVIEGMQQLSAEGLTPVVGYEANGGFLLDSAIERGGRTLAALPTRDALLVALTILAAALNIGLNLLLVPRFGTMAAAINTLVAFVALFIMTYVVGQRVYPLQYQWSRLLLVFGLALALFAVGWWLVPPSNLLVSIALKLALLAILPALLWFTGFLTPAEKARVRQVVGTALGRVKR